MSAADAIDAKPKKTPAANAVRRKRFMLAPQKKQNLTEAVDRDSNCYPTNNLPTKYYGRTADFWKGEAGQIQLICTDYCLL